MQAATKDYAIVAGGAGTACIMNTAGFWRTMEQVFIDLLTDEPAGLRLIDRFLDVQYERMVRTLEAGRGLLLDHVDGRRPGHAEVADDQHGALPQAHPPAPAALRRPGA